MTFVDIHALLGIEKLLLGQLDITKSLRIDIRHSETENARPVGYHLREANTHLLVNLDGPGGLTDHSTIL